MEGFERMPDDVGIGVEMSARSGGTDSDVELIGNIPMDGIVVKTNMEQKSEITK